MCSSYLRLFSQDPSVSHSYFWICSVLHSSVLKTHICAGRCWLHLLIYEWPEEVQDILVCANFGAIFYERASVFLTYGIKIIQDHLTCWQMDSGHGDLGTLASVVTSLANLSDSLKENLNNGDTSDSQQEEQSASEITRSVCPAQS